MSDDDPAIESPAFIQRPLKARKGRGAVSNLQGRYEVLAREAVDDGWLQAEPEHLADEDPSAVHSGHAQGAGEAAASRREQEDAQPAALKTEIIEERAKTILTRNQSPDVPFSISLNPYRGCEHGCIYCFARPTHSYLGLSPGLDFESRIFAKTNAPELLRQELSKKSYIPEPIALGVNTDAYQPCERELRLTRGVLEVLSECGHPVALITKSSLIERDIDLLVLAEILLARNKTAE